MPAQPTSWLQNLGIAIEVICPALALIVTTLRVYIRSKSKNLGWDDAFIILAMALSLAMAVGSVIVMKVAYIGIHVWDVPQDADFTSGLLWIYVVGAVYNPILALVKQSVLTLLLRLAGTKPAVRMAVWITAVFNAAEMVAVFLAVIFQCTPIEAFWKPQLLMEGGHCIEAVPFGLATGCLTILTDLATLALPIYIFFDLKINKRTKLALIFVFLLGFLVTIVSVIRLYYFQQHLTDTTDPDPTFNLGFCVSSIECNLGIITACGPAMWPLLRSWMPRLFSRLGISNGYQRKDDDNNENGWTPSDGSGISGKKTAPGGATNTIGGNSIGMDNLKDLRGDGARGKTDIRVSRMEDSDEEVLTHQGVGIMRRTDYVVSRDDQGQSKASSRHGHDDAVSVSDGKATGPESVY